MGLIKPGITTHDVARMRPFPRISKSADELRKNHSEWMNTDFNNHFGGIGIRWDDAPVCNLDAPEITLEKNMIVTYHAQYRIDGYEGVAIENTYRITDTGCENMCKWPFEDLMIIGT
jgi:Xaa-Pro aminopeptidase